MTTAIPAIKIPCRALNPSKCRYHGAELRAEAALRAGDKGAYLTAQIDLAAAISSTPEVLDFFADKQKTQATVPANANVNPDVPAAHYEQPLQPAWAAGIVNAWRHNQSQWFGFKVEDDAPATHGAGKLSDRELVTSINLPDGTTKYYRFAYGDSDKDYLQVRPQSITEVKKVTVPTDEVAHYSRTNRAVPQDIQDIGFLTEMGEHLSETSTDKLPEITGLISKTSSDHYYSIKNVTEANDTYLPYDLADNDRGYTVTFEDLTSNLHYKVDMIRGDGDTRTVPLIRDNGRTVDAAEPAYSMKTEYKAI